jgi:hypothetical protein
VGINISEWINTFGLFRSHMCLCPAASWIQDCIPGHAVLAARRCWHRVCEATTFLNEQVFLWCCYNVCEDRWMSDNSGNRWSTTRTKMTIRAVERRKTLNGRTDEGNSRVMKTNVIIAIRENRSDNAKATNSNNNNWRKSINPIRWTTAIVLLIDQ